MNLCGHHLLDIFGEHVDCKLVGCHHDGRVGYLSYQLCSQAPANKKEFYKYVPRYVIKEIYL